MLRNYFVVGLSMDAETFSASPCCAPFYATVLLLIAPAADGTGVENIIFPNSHAIHSTTTAFSLGRRVSIQFD